ncbi:MAG: Trp biosynthesis-associated membrane protein [Candidatus Nanopelagicales bacterium]
MTGRTGYLVALVLLAAGGLVAAVGYGRPWAVVVPAQGGLPLPAVEVSGVALVPAGLALALVLAAGALAVVATGGWLRRVLGGLLAAVATAVAVPAVAYRLGDPVADATRSALDRVGDTAATVDVTAWWLTALLGGLAGLVGGVAVAARGHRWPGMSARYTRTAPGAGAAGPGGTVAPGGDGPRDAAASDGSGADAPGAGRVGGAVAWDALDRGEDPTD